MPWEGTDLDAGKVFFYVNKVKGTAAAAGAQSAGSKVPPGISKAFREAAALYCSRDKNGAYETKRGSYSGERGSCWEAGYMPQLPQCSWTLKTLH